MREKQCTRGKSTREAPEVAECLDEGQENAEELELGVGCRSWKAWGPTAGLGCKWKRESLEGFEPTALLRPSFNRPALLPGEQTEGGNGGGGDGQRGAAAATQGGGAGGWAGHRSSGSGRSRAAWRVF